MRPAIIETVDSTNISPYILSVGQTAQGNLSSSEDVDYYTTYVNAGQTYSISVIGTGQNPVRDPQLQIWGGSEGDFSFNYDISSNYPWAQLIYQATSTGNISIVLRGQGREEPGAQYGLSISSGSRSTFDYLMGAGAVHSTTTSYWGTGQGEGVTVSYGFRNSAAPYAVADTDMTSFSKLNTAQQDAVKLALNLWTDICGIKFVAVNEGGYTDNATILFGNYFDRNDGAGAFAYKPLKGGNTISTSPQGDVWFNLTSVATSVNLLQQGSYSFFTIMHEIGHALGLTHPGPYQASSGLSITYSNSAKFVQDSGQYTVMSYFDGVETGQSPGFNESSDTPMLFDILAMQYLYGANMLTRTGDTVYGFGSNAGSTYNFSINRSPQLCIWDAGGTDTLDCSGYSQNQAINLSEGMFSDVGGQVANLSIALNVTIENAIGGSGNDTIYGNSANNTIAGNAGDDILEGNSGDDNLAGGDGNDLLYGGTGNDTFDWDANSRFGNDTMYGGGGNDIYVIDSAGDRIVEYVNEGIDTIWASFTYSISSVANVENIFLYGDANINATGNNLNNVLRSNSGNNIFNGSTGIDTALYQGAAAGYAVTIGSTTDTVVDRTSNRDGTDTLIDVERLKFSDTNLALDIGRYENAGQAYRLYKAAFNRLPDQEGLGFWIYAFDNGSQLNDVAQGFINSDEFPTFYGFNSPNAVFLSKLYNNVLGRNYDQEGYNFWLAALNNGLPRNSILAQFSESPENISNVIDLIGQGIPYKEWLG